MSRKINRLFFFKADMVTCLVCKVSSNEKQCDFCNRGICQLCENMIRDETTALQRKYQRACVYCRGTKDYNQFCYACKERVRLFIYQFKKLSNYSIFRKFGATNLQEVTPQQALDIMSKPIICRCTTRCNCVKNADNTVQRKYNIDGYTLHDFIDYSVNSCWGRCRVKCSLCMNEEAKKRSLS